MKCYKTDYELKLEDHRWLIKRMEILERDLSVCADCYATESIMHVHHLYYIFGHEPWEYPDEAFVTLCEGCHQEEHERWNRYEGPERPLHLKKLGFRAKDFENLCFSLFAEKIGMSSATVRAIDDCLKMIERRADNHRRQIEMRGHGDI